MKIFKTLFVAILFYSGVLAFGQEYKQGLFNSGQADEIVTYKTIGDITLKLHAFYPEENAPNGNPAILFFHGGGFRIGNVTQFYPFCEKFKKIGITCFSVEYRIRDKHNSTRNQSIMDGFTAMRYVRQNAKKFNIDPDRIAAGGGSAGGFIAASLATVTILNESTDDMSISAHPDALVLFNPGSKGKPSTSENSTTEYDWKDLSPYHNIVAGHPPTLIMHGTLDEAIPVEHSKDYAEKLKSLGIKCVLKLYEGQTHSFFNKWRGEKYFELTSSEALIFLNDLWLK